jgi:thioredoxin 1
MAGGSNLVHLTDQNWEQEVVKATVPVLVDFSAAWCGPCRLLAPVVEKLAEELAGKVKVGKLDTDESPDVAAKYSIRSLPTVMVFLKGEIKSKHLGHTTRENLLKLLAL